MIDLTPLEVRKKKGDFRRAMRGYDTALVDDFLDLVADRMDELVREAISLADRLGRQEQQVADFRERERALTEALVTAQEMREEIREQTSREADLVRRTAEQEAAQLRARVEQEVSEIRAQAEGEAARLQSAAQQDATRLRSAAQQEAAQLRSAAQQEAVQLIDATQRSKEREQDALRRLQARQEQFLASYRGLLERELSELAIIAQTLAGAHAASGAEGVMAPGEAGEPAAALPGLAGAAAPDAGSVADGADVGLVAPEIATGADASGAEPLAGEAFGVESRGADAFGADAFGDEAFEAEPFEPEPFEAEPFEAEPFEAEPFEAEPFEAEPPGLETAGLETAGLETARVETARLEQPEPGPAEADPLVAEHSGMGQFEAEGLLDAGPGEIIHRVETTGQVDPAELDAPRLVVDRFGAEEDAASAAADVDRELAQLSGELAPEEAEEDTALLLRNAAAAGYGVADAVDLDDELLLEDAIPEDGPEGHAAQEEGGDWLEDILEEDR
jgi:cell division initiation protein